MDLGCGSGAIGLALLGELAQRGVAATLVGVDESDDALVVARANALKHDLQDARFVRSSWFDDVDEALRGRIDLIVANPPYVGADEFEHLDAVLRHEPLGAIISNDSGGVVGFEDLATIIASAPGWLAAKGVLVCEHSNLHRDAVLDARVARASRALRTSRIWRGTPGSWSRDARDENDGHDRRSRGARHRRRRRAADRHRLWDRGISSLSRAVAALFVLKRRPATLALPVLVSSVDQIESLGVVWDGRAGALSARSGPER